MPSCRYCPLYCPSYHTPIWGYCAGKFPPLKVQGITDSCPYNGDSREIENVARSRGFLEHDLRGIYYYGISEEGVRTRIYSDLDKLREDAGASGLVHTLYSCFVDADGFTFFRAVIPEGAER